MKSTFSSSRIQHPTFIHQHNCNLGFQIINIRNTRNILKSHQVLWASLLQFIQLSVHCWKVLVNGIKLCLQIFVLLMVMVKFTLVVIALLLICYWRKFTGGRKWEEWEEKRMNRMILEDHMWKHFLKIQRKKKIRQIYDRVDLRGNDVSKMISSSGLVMRIKTYVLPIKIVVIQLVSRGVVICVVVLSVCVAGPTWSSRSGISSWTCHFWDTAVGRPALQWQFLDNRPMWQYNNTIITLKINDKG